jgi:pyruvate kinase
VNLPGIEVNLPALTEKDERDVRAGVAAGIDFVALSFVRKSEDIATLQALLKRLGSRARIIAKIEDQSGLRNLKEIVKAADAVMVARGDLGIEIDYHTLPLVQTRIVELCLAEGKPVIIATHLLESMILAPMPTRAEISDVSTAVRERADAVMLSGETTTGLYPLECVDVMKNIIRSIEPTERRGINETIQLREPKSKMLRSAAGLAQELGRSGIVVFTRSGFLAHTLAALRAVGVPLYAFTDDDVVFRQLLLAWGVEPFLMPFSNDPEETIQSALAYLKRAEWCAEGTWVVFITNALAHGKVIDTLQIRQIDRSIPVPPLAASSLQKVDSQYEYSASSFSSSLPSRWAAAAWKARRAGLGMKPTLALAREAASRALRRARSSCADRARRFSSTRLPWSSLWPLREYALFTSFAPVR